MRDGQTNIYAIILGSFLGFLATLVSAQFSNWLKNRSQRRAFGNYLKLEFSSIKESLEAIRTAFEHQHFYDFLLIDILDKNIADAQDARKNASLIKNTKLQEKLFSIVNRVALLAKDMRGIQNYAYKTTLPDENGGSERPMTPEELESRNALVEEKRRSHAIEIVELKREAEEFNDKI